MKTTRPNALDRLVTNCTAFPSWRAMQAAMKAGYVPTLNGGRSYLKLAGVCRRNGYRVFRGGLAA